VTSAFVVHDVQRNGRSIANVVRPTSIHEALEALGDGLSRPMAGGTDLLLDLQRGGPGDPVSVVDLTTIEGFRSITDEGDHWLLAGGVTHNQIVQHEGLRNTALPLAQACLEVGSPQLRNRATIAGNLVTASPANDTISALMVLDASLELSQIEGEHVVVREVAVADFFTGFRSTLIIAGELITAIRVPKLGEQERAIWVKLGLRRAQAISVVHGAIVVGLDGAVVASAKLALGSVAETVVMVSEFADALRGKVLDDETIAAVATASASAVSPISDGRATAEYRTMGIEVLVARALHALANRQQASMWPESPPTLSTPEQLTVDAPCPSSVLEDSSIITVEVNGTSVSGSKSTMTLLDWVRDEAGSTGMKEGCAEGECGACTMLLDGAAVMSCLVTAAQADGRAVSTVEGLDHPIQRAFVDEFAVQCGFCIPGFLVSAARLLDETDEPDDDQIRLGLSGNLCRCTGYYPIIDAVRDAAVELRGQHG
jgi:xanthine dehydrogenase iron-sulfur cluster and FAD-binding subunit A